MAVTLGIDSLKDFLRPYKKKKVSVLCHPSSISSKLEHAFNIVDENTILKSAFGPQHGIRGETQDNMIEWQDQTDAKGRPVYSLYGQRRKPSIQSLEGTDLVVVDLFDVGARYYTFIYTMAYMLEVCGKLKIPVVVCDRPNPLGGQFIEGSIHDLNFKSFVGLYEIPVCHGMTVGELARFFCATFKEAPELTILKMKSWNRNMHWPETGRLWTLPSPNMPNYEAALLYPGMCLVEGTSFSEGRGTTRPFELIGAPFFDWDLIDREYRDQCKKLKLQPVHFHRQGFIPNFHKYSGELCFGALQFVSQPKKFQPLRHAAVLFHVLRKLYGDKWSWKKPPYEYEFEKWPIDILTGGVSFRECVDQQLSLKDLFKHWAADEAKFKKLRKNFLLY